jgi:hypothetical protein
MGGGAGTMAMLATALATGCGAVCAGKGRGTQHGAQASTGEPPPSGPARAAARKPMEP